MKCKNCGHKIEQLDLLHSNIYWTHARTKKYAGNLPVADYSSHCGDINDGCQCVKAEPLTSASPTSKGGMELKFKNNPCPDCGGSGWIINREKGFEERCQICNGKARL